MFENGMQKYIYNKCLKHSVGMALVPKLVYAVCVGESNLNQFSYRKEKGFFKTYMLKDRDHWVKVFYDLYPDRTDVAPPSDAELIDLFSASYGIMQIMYPVAREYGFTGHPFGLYDIDRNIAVGAKVLNHRYMCFPEIDSSVLDRMIISVVAYNAGRGSANKMLKLAREAEGVKSYKDPGKWQTWDYSKNFLHKVTGNSAAITIRYIDRIMPILTADMY